MPCPANSFKNASGDGASLCEACPDFASSLAGSTLRTNCTCQGGYLGLPGEACGLVCPPGAARGPFNRVCYACNSSTYKPAAGDHNCTPCPPFSHHHLTNQTSVDACMCQIGYLWNAASQLCDKCPPGTFNNRANDTRCFPCVSMSNTPPVSCVASESDGTGCPGLCQAPAGYEVTGDNLKECDPNHYQDGSGIQCTPCPTPSTFTAHGGLLSVAECACTAGHSRVSGVCLACAVDRYKPGPGDAGCALCPADTTTLETGSTVASQCVCKVGFELVGGICRSCVAPAAKHHPGNEACINCGPGAALKPSEPHARNACECQAGFAGARDACLACAQGSYATGPGAEECVLCAEHATTAQAASASIASCFCSPSLLWEAAATGGPNVPGGSCVSSCAPGLYGAGSVCALCLEGSYKPDQGPQACTPCAPPRSSSRPGSVLPTNCSCPAGLMLDPSGGSNATVASVGPLSALGLATTVLNNCLAGCVQAENPATRLASLSLSGPDVRDVTVTVDTGGATLVLYACTSDCLATVALYGSRGRLTLSAPATVSASVLRHTRRTATLAPNPGQLDQAAAERLVLQHGLRPGSTLWGASVALAQANPACLPCAQGLVCASYI